METIDLEPDLHKTIQFDIGDASHSYAVKFVVEGERAEIDMSDSLDWSGSLGKNPTHISDCPDTSLKDEEIYSYYNGTEKFVTSHDQFGEGWFGRVDKCGGGGAPGTPPPRNFWVDFIQGESYGVKASNKKTSALVGERIKLEGYLYDPEEDDETKHVTILSDWKNPEKDDEETNLAELFSESGDILSADDRKNKINVFAGATKAGTYTFPAMPHDEIEGGRSSGVSLNFHSLDLDIDGVNDEDEVDPGGNILPGTNNLQKIKINLEPSRMPDHRVTLSVNEGVGLIKIWENSDATQLVLPSALSYKTWASNEVVPTSMYVELLNTNSVVSLELSYEGVLEDSSGIDLVKFNKYNVLIDPEKPIAVKGSRIQLFAKYYYGNNNNDKFDVLANWGSENEELKFYDSIDSENPLTETELDNRESIWVSADLAGVYEVSLDATSSSGIITATKEIVFYEIKITKLWSQQFSHECYGSPFNPGAENSTKEEFILVGERLNDNFAVGVKVEFIPASIEDEKIMFGFATYEHSGEPHVVAPQINKPLVIEKVMPVSYVKNGDKYHLNTFDTSAYTNVVGNFVCAGIDLNDDGKLDKNEVGTVFENLDKPYFLKFVTKKMSDVSEVELVKAVTGGVLSGRDVAATMMYIFLNKNIAGTGFGVVRSNDKRLEHVVGLNVNGACSDNFVRHFTFLPGEKVSNECMKHPKFKEYIRAFANSKLNEIISKYDEKPLLDVKNITVEISEGYREIDYNQESTLPENVHAAFGKAEIFGGVTFAVTKNDEGSYILVSAQANLVQIDLYDFDYPEGGWNAHAARVQTGYGTASNITGNIFTNEVLLTGDLPFINNVLLGPVK